MHKIKHIRFVVYLSCMTFFITNHVAAQDISRFIDSIEQQNIYAHDTVKIKNFIKIYEHVVDENPDTALYFIDEALKIDSLNETSDFSFQLLLKKAQILQNKHLYPQSLEILEKCF